jgi:transcriptional regulator with XRE-family HTH domain
VNEYGSWPGKRTVEEPKRSPFGRRLRALRHARGWSQPELAERAGLNPHTIAYLECGGRAKYQKPVANPKKKGKDLGPHRATVEKLADALGCGIYDLIECAPDDVEMTIEWVPVGGTLKPKLTRRDSNSRPAV